MPRCSLGTTPDGQATIATQWRGNSPPFAPCNRYFSGDGFSCMAAISETWRFDPGV